MARAALNLALTALCCAAMLVFPDSSCSGETLEWLVVEPLARAVGVHHWFVAAGPFGALVGLVPLIAAGLGLMQLVTSWGAIREARQASESPGPALVGLGLGTLTVVASAWAGLLWWLLI